MNPVIPPSWEGSWEERESGGGGSRVTTKPWNREKKHALFLHKRGKVVITILLSPFYRRWNEGTAKVSGLVTATKLVGIEGALLMLMPRTRSFQHPGSQTLVTPLESPSQCCLSAEFPKHTHEESWPRHTALLSTWSSGQESWEGSVQPQDWTRGWPPPCCLSSLVTAGPPPCPDGAREKDGNSPPKTREGKVKILLSWRNTLFWNTCHLVPLTRYPDFHLGAHPCPPTPPGSTCNPKDGLWPTEDHQGVPPLLITMTGTGMALWPKIQTHFLEESRRSNFTFP